MENEQKKLSIKSFLPLICSIVTILFLLGDVLTYKIKIPSGSDVITKEFSIHLWNMFDESICPSWLILVILSFLVCGALLPILGSLFENKTKESFSISAVFCFLITLCLLVSYKEVFSHFASSKILYFKSASVSYGLACSILTSICGAFTSLLSTGKDYGKNVRRITEDGILIAMAFVLNFFKLPIATGGGSVNFQMLPLFIIALRRGPLHGFISGGIIYGLLTCLSDGYGFMLYPFDYLIGFGSVAILGFFQKFIADDNKRVSLKNIVFCILGCILATLVRYIGSTVSSIVFYNLNFVAALAYNAVYIPVSGAIALAALILILKPFKIINQHYPVN